MAALTRAGMLIDSFLHSPLPLPSSHKHQFHMLRFFGSVDVILTNHGRRKIEDGDPLLFAFVRKGDVGLQLH